LRLGKICFKDGRVRPINYQQQMKIAGLLCGKNEVRLQGSVLQENSPQGKLFLPSITKNGTGLYIASSHSIVAHISNVYNRT